MNDDEREVSFQEIRAKTLTRVRGTTDPWFLSRYGMNLYRGCQHGCAYCDGRAEKYYVEGDFDRSITVKVNAVTLLDGELTRAREPGFVFLGGGVSDAYQPAELRYGLARGVLELALRRGLPVHVLTKSALVERDLDLLAAIQARASAILSFSICTTDEAVREIFEPGAAPLADRWRLLRKAKEMGIGTGVWASPVLPGISDRAPAIDRLVAHAKAQDVDFLCHSGLTLRPGNQRKHYIRTVADYRPSLLGGYERLYRERRASGNGDRRYYDRIDRRFHASLRRHELAERIPHRLFRGLLPLYAEVAVLLEHRETALRRARRQCLGLARSGAAIQKWCRDRLARHGRGANFCFERLEQELRFLIASGCVADHIRGVTPQSIPVLERIVADLASKAPLATPSTPMMYHCRDVRSR